MLDYEYVYTLRINIVLPILSMICPKRPVLSQIIIQECFTINIVVRGGGV